MRLGKFSSQARPGVVLSVTRPGLQVMQMAKDARQQRLAWRHLDSGMTTAYKDAGFSLPLSTGQ